jgi:phage tail-like protein
MKTNRLFLVSTPLALVLAALFLADAQAAKEKFVRNKPHVNIVLDTADLDLTGFRQVDGAGVEIETVDDPSALERKRPGRTTYSNITLKRGYTGATDVQEWATLAGGLPLRDISLLLVTRSAEPLGRFELIGCFPTRWQISTDSRGAVIETLEIRVNRIEFAKS